MRFKISSCATLGATLLGLWTLPADAQPINWRPEYLSLGDVMTLDLHPGGRFHHVYRKRENLTFFIDIYHGALIAGKPVETQVLDRRGNVLREIAQNGQVTTYKPHNCVRTSGSCTYSRISGDGSVRSFLRRTQITPSGFSFKLYDPKGDSLELLEEGQFELDRTGFAVKGWTRSKGVTNSYTYVPEIDQ